MTIPESTADNCGTPDPQVSLTRRERDILSLLAQGLSNKEIAEQLCLSEKSVRNRVSEILSKLGVSNRTQAAIWAKENGLDSGQQEQSENPEAR
jgi:DNA-binding NarL/FixJ family response regulator